MRTYISFIAALGSFAVMATPSSVLASGCGYGNPCDPGVVVSQSQPRFDPLSIQIKQPYGHFKSIKFQRSPNVSIMRVHGLGPTAGIADAPSGFAVGCPSHATQHCNGTMGVPANIAFNAVPAPVVSAPVVSAPVAYAPAPIAVVPATPVQVTAPTMAYGSMTHGSVGSAVSHGMHHSQSKFEPRQYGSMQDGFSHGTQNRVVSAPAQPYISPPLSVSRSVSGGVPVQVNPTTQASPVAVDGTYWEQVSGPTVFGDTVATKVICKRQLPKRVVNPVVGVPLPVPTHAGCVPEQGPSAVSRHGVSQAPLASGLAGGPGYAQAPAEDWSF